MCAGSGLSAAQVANQVGLRAREAVAKYYEGTLVSDDELMPVTTRNICLRAQVQCRSRFSAFSCDLLTIGWYELILRPVACMQQNFRPLDAEIYVPAWEPVQHSVDHQYSNFCVLLHRSGSRAKRMLPVLHSVSVLASCTLDVYMLQSLGLCHGLP